MPEYSVDMMIPTRVQTLVTANSPEEAAHKAYSHVSFSALLVRAHCESTDSVRFLKAIWEGVFDGFYVRNRNTGEEAQYRYSSKTLPEKVHHPGVDVVIEVRDDKIVHVTCDRGSTAMVLNYDVIDDFVAELKSKPARQLELRDIPNRLIIDCDLTRNKVETYMKTIRDRLGWSTPAAPTYRESTTPVEIVGGDDWWGAIKPDLPRGPKQPAPAATPVVYGYSSSRILIS